MDTVVITLFLVWVSVIGSPVRTEIILTDLKAKCKQESGTDFIVQPGPERHFKYTWDDQDIGSRAYVGLDFICYRKIESLKNPERDESENIENVPEKTGEFPEKKPISRNQKRT